MTGITCEVVRRVAVLSPDESSYTKELNLVSWNGAEPKVDIRTWSPDRKALKGLTMTEDEAKKLCEALNEMFG